MAADTLGDINQRHGRTAGDQVIKGLAEYLKAILGEDEKLGHIDGTNFAVVMHADLEEATNRARKWRTQIRSRPFPRFQSSRRAIARGHDARVVTGENGAGTMHPRRAPCTQSPPAGR
jgi:GGDEF domain-containing protein